MRRARPFIAGVALIAVVAVVAVLQHRRAVRPDARQVAVAAFKGPVARAVPAGFPDFSARGWRAEGSRTDEIGGRTLVTVSYRRRNELMTYSEMADTRGLNDGGATVLRMRPAGGGHDLSLTWQAGAPELSVRFVRGGHQTVLAGRPATPALGRELGALAVASVRPAA
jgi:hypothetical protein